VFSKIVAALTVSQTNGHTSVQGIVSPLRSPPSDHLLQSGAASRWRSRAGLGLLFLWLGSISLGGKSTPLLFDHLRRRGRLTQADWLEGYSLAKILPGSTGVSGSIFFANRFAGLTAAPILCGLYVLPGMLAALALTLLIYGGLRPPWLEGAAFGMSAGALALLLATTLRSMTTTVRTARFGALVAALAFVTYGVFGLDVLVVLITVGSLSVLASWRQTEAK